MADDEKDRKEGGLVVAFLEVEQAFSPKVDPFGEQLSSNFAADWPDNVLPRDNCCVEVGRDALNRTVDVMAVNTSVTAPTWESSPSRTTLIAPFMAAITTPISKEVYLKRLDQRLRLLKKRALTKKGMVNEVSVMASVCAAEERKQDSPPIATDDINSSLLTSKSYCSSVSSSYIISPDVDRKVQWASHGGEGIDNTASSNYDNDRRVRNTDGTCLEVDEEESAAQDDNPCGAVACGRALTTVCSTAFYYLFSCCVVRASASMYAIVPTVSNKNSSQ